MHLIQVQTYSMASSEKLEDIENICYKCARKISDHPPTGRFRTIILHGQECAWNPDIECRDYVICTLKSSGYNLQDFGHD
jgi:hypothetical protein